MIEINVFRVGKRPEDLGRAAVSDPAEFWSSISPSQSIALLRAAPKVAPAWEPVPWMVRRYTIGRTILAEIDCAVSDATSAKDADSHTTATRYYWSTTTKSGYTRSLAAAKTAADSALRAAGWILCDEVTP